MTPEQERAAYPFALNRRCLSSSKSRARSAFSGSAFSASAAICASSLARRARSAGVRWSGISSSLRKPRATGLFGVIVAGEAVVGNERIPTVRGGLPENVKVGAVILRCSNLFLDDEALDEPDVDNLAEFPCLLGFGAEHCWSPWLASSCNAKQRYVSNGKMRYGENNSPRGDHLKEMGQ